MQQEAMQEPEMTPEQVEDQVWNEAAALAGLTDAQPETVNDDTVQPTEEVQADPATQVESDDAGEATPPPAEEPPQAAAPPDPFAEATPEQRQAWENLVAEKARLEHDSHSNRNRVSALQRKLNEIEAKVQAQPEPTAPVAEPTPTPQAVESTPPEGLKEFQEDFPEIYKAVNSMYEQKLNTITQSFESRLAEVQTQLSTQVQNVAAPVEQLQATEEDKLRQSQLEAFASVHPDYAEIQNSEEFWGWVDQQADGVKALAGSVAATDNIALLNLYKSSSPAYQQVTQQQPQAAPAPAAPSGPERTADVALPRVAAAGSVQQGIDPNDEDAAWDYWTQNYDKI